MTNIKIRSKSSFKNINMACSIFLAITMSNIALAQVCDENTIVATTSSDKFIINTDGTVNDISTGLMWTRCSIGQTLTADNKCTGDTSTMSWQEALSTVLSENNEKAYGYDDWRLPNIKELQTIVEHQCFNPAINLSVFPDTPAAAYYSSTPDFSSADLARYIYFVDGQQIAPPTQTNRHVRMVRNIK